MFNHLFTKAIKVSFCYYLFIFLELIFIIFSPILLFILILKQIIIIYFLYFFIFNPSQVLILQYHNFLVKLYFKISLYHLPYQQFNLVKYYFQIYIIYQFH